ncbi:hypothetical protein ABXN37_21470 [Piscinibacter sakaiensis]|uniref:Uncharacterized protein n=1 Tax=Piscinibacter sakaiensis TaxID=1547922 RepID=A0A0K8P552_PISS1|nr:hypothetical protein [Piscinibacter sakaiensis]GAP37696.1 hypothetical protein ISF6_3641 [Piscinibacter sakaiensis]
MISRRSASALVFASLATLSVTVAADARIAATTAAARPATPAAVPMPVFELPRVVVTGRPRPQSAAH